MSSQRPSNARVHRAILAILTENDIATLVANSLLIAHEQARLGRVLNAYRASQSRPRRPKGPGRPSDRPGGTIPYGASAAAARPERDCPQPGGLPTAPGEAPVKCLETINFRMRKRTVGHPQLFSGYTSTYQKLPRDVFFWLRVLIYSLRRVINENARPSRSKDGRRETSSRLVTHSVCSISR